MAPEDKTNNVVDLARFRIQREFKHLSKEHHKELLARMGKSLAQQMIRNHEMTINPPLINGVKISGIWLDEFDEINDRVAKKVLGLPPETP